MCGAFRELFASFASVGDVLDVIVRYIAFPAALAQNLSGRIMHQADGAAET
jgi:hypothetical protein